MGNTRPVHGREQHGPAFRAGGRRGRGRDPHLRDRQHDPLQRHHGQRARRDRGGGNQRRDEQAEPHHEKRDLRQRLSIDRPRRDEHRRGKPERRRRHAQQRRDERQSAQHRHGLRRHHQCCIVRVLAAHRGLRRNGGHEDRRDPHDRGVQGEQRRKQQRSRDPGRRSERAARRGSMVHQHLHYGRGRDVHLRSGGSPRGRPGGGGRGHGERDGYKLEHIGARRELHRDGCPGRPVADEDGQPRSGACRRRAALHAARHQQRAEQRDERRCDRQPAGGGHAGLGNAEPG